MADLVDYLRDKLAHADDPVCTCEWILVGWGGETTRGRTNPDCAIHGDHEYWIKIPKRVDR